MREIRVFENPDELTVAAAELFIQIAVDAISDRGQFAVALSGGSTPAPVYKLLAESYRDAIDWKQVFFFFSDERQVPPDSQESNFRMADEALFSALQLPKANVHEWRTLLGGADQVAREYASEIMEFFEGFPKFDLILLGLGADSHTASLFPQSPALKEIEEVAVANWVEKLAAYRLTLTFPVINNAANAMFVVSGKEKAEAAVRVLKGEFRPDEFPAQFVNPANGALYWLLDNTAASKLS